MESLQVLFLILKISTGLAIGIGCVSFIISRWDPNLLSGFCTLVIMGLMLWYVFICVTSFMPLASKPGL